MNAVQAHIQLTPGLIGDDADVGNQDTADSLRKYMQGYAACVQRVSTMLAAGRLSGIAWNGGGRSRPHAGRGACLRGQDDTGEPG
jgi:hypothetical protein